MADIKPGETTSENKVTKSMQFFAYFATIASLVATYGPKLIDSLPDGGTATAIVAAVVSGTAVLAALFTSLGYIKSRTDVKVSADASPSE